MSSLSPESFLAPTCRITDRLSLTFVADFGFESLIRSRASRRNCVDHL